MNRWGKRTGLRLGLALLLIGVCAGADYRLGGSVVPSFYNLTIDVLSNADEPTVFNGEVSIALQVVGTTEVRQITLHKDAIDIEECWLYNESGDQVQPIDSSQLIYEEATQQLTVPLSQALANGAYTLGFKYTGKIRTDMAGLFSASYVEQDTGKTKWLAVTQMQRINARLVFPCFDEPAFKAQFQLHIVRPSGYEAISNTKLLYSSAESEDRFVDHFEVTPAMSTYLLAFIIAEYTARGNVSEFAVLTRPEFYNKTEFSFQVGQRVVAAYDELFQQPYASLGNDVLQYATSPRFPHNGMENWGLIIYSDDVLVKELGYTDGWSDKEFTIRIIAHETSHMWFGDSVTFSWWSYFWLNEAFARYYEYFMAHQLYPEYRLDEQFVVRQMQLIFATDAVNSTQPMTSPEASIQTPSQIGYKFSSIAYAKGACIVRMWRNVMGANNFDTAIRNYLKQNHLGNTRPNDLFYHLIENWPADQYVNQEHFLSDFTEQVGYPMLIVNASRNNHVVYVEQQRFLLNRGDGSDPDLRYTVPITYATNLAPDFENLTPKIYHHKPVDIVKLSFEEEAIDWIVLNLKQSNYYRVLYDKPLLDSLQVALSSSNHSGVPVENRAQIVDDLFNFARVGYIDYANVFEFMEYLSQDVDYVPWYATYQGLQFVAKRLPLNNLPNFKKYLSDITDAVFAKLGVTWSPDDTVLDVYNRNNLVGWLCRYQARDCNQLVADKFTNDFAKPSPDYRQTFYCAAARSESYEHVMQFYREETNPKERELLWAAASCTRSYLAHYQNEILANGSTVSQKTIALAQMYEQNPDLINQIFNMLAANITQLAEALDNDWSTTAVVISDLAEYFTTREQHQLLSNFYDSNHLLFGQSASVLSKALETVDENVQWAEMRLNRLVYYLSKRNGGQQSAQVLVMLLALPMLLAWL
ncbi:aminopeptidase N [Drosophila miranda]|uniref:aminopeptidase N n=1 Tax=Drosophila miranda TaxID=7229 RepID=UPI00143F3A65|nr:aminopeptidase N [Drosophila miranda]